MLPVRLLLRLCLATDFSLGVLLYTVMTVLWGENLRLGIVLFSLVCTHLPDVDMIPFLILRKRLRLSSHWVVGHHPLILIPAAAFVGWYSAEIFLVSPWYLAALGAAGVLAHFVHDGSQKQGIAPLSPFFLVSFRITFAGGVPRHVTPEYWLAFDTKERVKSRNLSAGGEITTRVHAPDRPAQVLAVLSWSVFGLFILWRLLL